MQAKIKVQKPGNLTKVLAFILFHELVLKQQHTPLKHTMLYLVLNFSAAEVLCFENSLHHFFFFNNMHCNRYLFMKKSILSFSAIFRKLLSDADQEVTRS